MPAIIYELIEEIIASTQQERTLVARLREAKELLSDVSKEFDRLVENNLGDPDIALWDRVDKWLGE